MKIDIKKKENIGGRSLRVGKEERKKQIENRNKKRRIHKKETTKIKKKRKVENLKIRADGLKRGGKKK